MTAKQHLATNDEASYAAAARWAEEEMTLPVNSPTALRGDEAVAFGRALLEEALGGAGNVQKAIRGRKTLGKSRPAGSSPKRQVTLPEELDRRVLTYVAAAEMQSVSALIREALTEYLDHHPTPAKV